MLTLPNHSRTSLVRYTHINSWCLTPKRVSGSLLSAAAMLEDEEFLVWRSLRHQCGVCWGCEASVLPLSTFGHCTLLHFHIKYEVLSPEVCNLERVCCNFLPDVREKPLVWCGTVLQHTAEHPADSSAVLVLLMAHQADSHT